MSSKKRSFLQPLAHDSAQHPKSLIRTAHKAEAILQEGALSSQQFTMMSGKANKKKRRILEPLTDTKAIDNLRKTDSAFMPSPTKLPSQKLLPLKNPIDLQDEGEVCECEQPVVAKVPDAVSESQDGMQMMILARNKNQIQHQIALICDRCGGQVPHQLHNSNSQMIRKRKRQYDAPETNLFIPDLKIDLGQDEIIDGQGTARL